MRIVHILHSHGYGGAESHVLIQIEGQRQRGHDVLFVGPLDSWLGEQCQQRQIPATHLRMTGLFDLPSHWRLRRLVRSWAPDIVHGHLVRASYYAGWAAGSGRSKPAAISTAHTTNALRHMERCRHIIADSGAIRQNLLTAGYPEDQVSVIFTGVPRAPAFDREEIRAELGLTPRDIVVGHAGRFIRDKGQDLLVQTMSMVQHPHVKLLLIGDPQTEFGRHVQSLPQDRNRLTYLGYRSDVPRLLRALDIYIQPSRREGLPLAISEAFDAELPLIATTVGGMPEIVQHNRTGLLTPPECPEALATAIDSLARDRDQARALALSGKRLFEERLNDQVMVDATLALYDRVLGQLAHARGRTASS
ncbi:MAG: glycosyltransferase [Burkholderiales bacterium]|nr:glycosyltransferase [Burkholderiales bacterium]